MCQQVDSVGAKSQKAAAEVSGQGFFLSGGKKGDTPSGRAVKDN